MRLAHLQEEVLQHITKKLYGNQVPTEVQFRYSSSWSSASQNGKTLPITTLQQNPTAGSQKPASIADSKFTSAGLISTKEVSERISKG